MPAEASDPASSVELARAPHSSREPGASPEPWTVRAAMWSAAHRWPVFVLWFVATIGLFVLSNATGGIATLDANGDPNEQQLESSEAYDVFNAGGTQEPPYERLVVVVGGGPGAVTSPAFKAGIETLVADLTAATAPVDGVTGPTFEQLADPLTAPPEAGLVSADGTTARIIGRVPGERAEVTQRLVPVPAIVDAARAANPGWTVHVISGTFINRDINDLISHDLDSSLRLTIPLTFLILLLAFGAIVASVIPLVLAITSLAAAFGLLGLYSQLVGSVSPNATQLIVLIGLAVAVDYSLFMVTRFRTERRAGRPRAAAIEIASSTAVRA
ncbi:MAG TPA: MMPL family transporter, partial [Candidatus Eisenbacteria bacterium]|nr:MMPL family transporter [Candidatus Eisenbacteria bacterium]